MSVNTTSNTLKDTNANVSWIDDNCHNHVNDSTT
jgi:hypothetical protein